MSKTMVDVIAGALLKHSSNYVRNEDGGGVVCGECGWEVASKRLGGSTVDRMNEHEVHAVLAALTKAGFGKVTA